METNRNSLPRAVFLLTMLLGVSFNLCLAATTYQIDFRAFYVAGKSFLAGLDPYVNNMGVSSEYLDPGVLRPNSKFIYPPQSLILFSLFSRISYPLAKGLFSLVLLMSLLILLRLFKEQPGSRRLYPGLLLFSFPVLASFERGQVDILVLLLCVLAYRRRDRWYSPLLLSMGISIKLFPILLLFHFLLIEKDLRYAARTLFFSVCILLLSLAVIPVERYSTFGDRLMGGLYLEQEWTFSLPADYRFSGSRIVTPDGQYTYRHEFVHGPLNPLFLLKKGGSLSGLAVFCALQLLFVKLRVPPARAFHANLLLILLPNRLLWIMGLVFYIPLAISCLRESHRLWQYALVSAPLFLPKWPFVPIIHVPYNFLIAILVALSFAFRDVSSDPGGPGSGYLQGRSA